LVYMLAFKTSQIKARNISSFLDTKRMSSLTIKKESSSSKKKVLKKSKKKKVEDGMK